MNLDVKHLPYDYQQTPSVDELLAAVITLALLQTVADDEEDDSSADYIPGYEYQRHGPLLPLRLLQQNYGGANCRRHSGGFTSFTVRDELKKSAATIRPSTPGR
jgi:hypothetical protein